MSGNSFTVQSPLGYTVVCSSEFWNHIDDRHPIMKENEKALVNAISDPVAIYSSEKWPEKRDVYFGKTSQATYGEKMFTKVVIDKPDEYNKEGQVISAWPQKSISGNINERGLRYVKSKL